MTALEGPGPAPTLGRVRGLFDSRADPVVREMMEAVEDGLCQEGATGAVLMCCEMIATGSSPRNGARPVTISYVTQPSE